MVPSVGRRHPGVLDAKLVKVEAVGLQSADMDDVETASATSSRRMQRLDRVVDRRRTRNNSVGPIIFR